MLALILAALADPTATAEAAWFASQGRSECSHGGALRRLEMALAPELMEGDIRRALGCQGPRRWAAKPRLRGGVMEGEVALTSEAFRWPGGHRVRVTPHVDGVAVDGASASVAVDREGTATRVVGPTLPRRDGSAWDIPSEAAVDRVRQRFGGGWWAPRTEERWLVHGERLRPAWRVDFSSFKPVFGTFSAWVDAETGQLLAAQQTSHDVGGLVYGTSPTHGSVEWVELDNLTSDNALIGLYSDAYSCTEWTISDTLFAVNTCDAVTRYAWPVDGAFAYAPNPGANQDPFAEAHLYFHVDAVGAYFDERYGLRPTAPLTTIANFPMANAFFGDFDGDGQADLSFGFVDRVQFAYDADVVYHEYGHWIVRRIADVPSLTADSYGLQWAGGSLNEGAADVFSMLLTEDPDLGEYTGQAFRDGPIRALERDRLCPGGLAGEVHRDGEIFASFGWNLIEAVGPELAGDVVFGAVSLWGPDIDWAKAGQSLFDSTDDLLAAGAIDSVTAGEIRDLIVASGMPDCGRVIPLTDEPVEAFVLSAGLEGDLYRIPGGAQLSFTVPEDADRTVVSISDFASRNEGLGWSLYFREDEPVEMRPTDLASFGLGFATAVTFDGLVDGEGDRDIVLDGSTFEVLPGRTYHLAVAGRDLGPIELFEFTLGRMDVRVRHEYDPPEPPRGCATHAQPPAVDWARRR